MSMQTKQFNAKDIQIVAGSREILAVISTDTVDRDGDVVLPSGLIKSQYSGNPIVLRDHDYTEPIGVTRWIKANDHEVLAKYYVSNKCQVAVETFGLLQDGVLRAHSIGFEILEASPPTSEELRQRPDWADARQIIRKWELLEFSVVAIPCNPEALALAVSKNYSPDLLKRLGHKEDCWTWSEKAVAPMVEETKEETPVVEEKKIVIPKAKYCRRITSVTKELRKLAASYYNYDEIVNSLRGKI